MPLARSLVLLTALFLGVSLFKIPIAVAQKGASPAQPQGSGAGAGGAGAGGSATPYFETQMLAYGGMNQLAQTVATQVCRDIGSKKPTVVIFDQVSFQNVQAWQAFVSSTLALKNAYETLLSRNEVFQLFPDEPHAPNLGYAFITSGSDLAALITAVAASTTNNASAFTIQDSSLAVSLTHQFSRQSSCPISLVYYPLFGSYVDLDDANKELGTTMQDLNQLRSYIQSHYVFSSNNDPNFLLFTDLNNEYDALLKSLSFSSNQGQSPQQGGGQPGQAPGTAQTPNATPSASGGQPSPVSLLQGAMLNRLLKRDNTYVLYADVVAAGGTQRDRKNILTLFTGDWISYSGGLIVNVALMNSSNSSVVFADTLRYRSRFSHIDDPDESDTLESPSAGENELSVCGHDPGNSACTAATNNPLPGLGSASTLTPINVASDVSQVAGGGTVNVSITVPDSLIPAQGVGILSLSTSNALATIPSPTVDVSQQTQQPITAAVHTASVADLEQVKITCRYSEKGLTTGTGETTLTLNPPVVFSRSSIPPGWQGKITITLPDTAANQRTVQLELVAGDSIILDQASVVVPPYGTQASVGFIARSVAALTQITVRASLSGNEIGRATVTILPPPPAA
jgi:hypothetical protein